MPTQEIRQQVNHLLEELYRWHLPLHDDEVVSYYEPDVGYFKSQGAHTEQNSFAISLATMDGEVFQVGAHDQLFALQSISKVFVYGPWPWRLADATAFWSGSGWSRAATLSTPLSSTSGITVRTTRRSTQGRSLRPTSWRASTPQSKLSNAYWTPSDATPETGASR